MQKPLLQTSYRRTAFQLSTDNIVRVSLDTDLMMTRDTPNCRTPGDWCRDTGAFPPGPSDAVHFPYGVVEVKLQAKPPAWLTKLVDSGLLMVVPKFSKFLHGTAALYQEYTGKTLNCLHFFPRRKSSQRNDTAKNTSLPPFITVAMTPFFVHLLFPAYGEAKWLTLHEILDF